MDVEEHLFRRESGRLVAVLARLFGMQNLQMAEDVVQDAFCRALETWKFHGVPKDPSAWLMTTAKRRALDLLRREGTARRFAPAVAAGLESEWTRAPAVEEAFAADRLGDAQLRMMFSCAHPRLPEEAQVALILHLLCGFSVAETAAAFLKNPAATEKRMARAKRTLAGSGRLFDLDSLDEAARRLPAVLRAIYLLFNEGYHGASPRAATRTELCEEALRLSGLLLEHPRLATPPAHALAALLNFHAARLSGRLDAHGRLAALFDQDRTRWDQARIGEGFRQLHLSARGEALTAYHVEAAIAAEHAAARRAQDTDWARILSLYDTLMRIRPGPVVALNRAVAVGEVEGPARALEEMRKLDGQKAFARYPFHYAALGEFEWRLGRAEKARQLFGAALELARNDEERWLLQERLQRCADMR